jgi:hypothetical protein
MQVDIEDGT